MPLTEKKNRLIGKTFNRKNDFPPKNAKKVINGKNKQLLIKPQVPKLEFTLELIKWTPSKT